MLVVGEQVDHGDHDRDIDERIACSKDHLNDLEPGGIVRESYPAEVRMYVP